jgi:hypothetical protein
MIRPGGPSVSVAFTSLQLGGAFAARVRCRQQRHNRGPDRDGPPGKAFPLSCLHFAAALTANVGPMDRRQQLRADGRAFVELTLRDVAARATRCSPTRATRPTPGQSDLPRGTLALLVSGPCSSPSDSARHGTRPRSRTWRCSDSTSPGYAAAPRVAPRDRRPPRQVAQIRGGTAGTSHTSGRSTSHKRKKQPRACSVLGPR